MKITDIIGSIVSAKNDWEHHLANLRAIRKEHTITWANFEKCWIGNYLSEDEFLNMVNDGQYSLQIPEDGSILQLFYSFNPRDNQLESACLAYYGSPDQSNENQFEFSRLNEIEPEVLEDDYEPEAGQTTSEISARWLRLEYERDQADRITHSKCHLHVGGMPETRIIVRGVPGPAQFIEWTMALFYPKIYQTHRLEDKETAEISTILQRINRLTLPFVEADITQQTPHLLIPTN